GGPSKQCRVAVPFPPLCRRRPTNCPYSPRSCKLGRMGIQPSEWGAPMSPWKRLIVRALAWGVGCGLAISLVLLSVYFYTQRAKGWDTRALRVKNAKAEALSLMNEQLAEHRNDFFDRFREHDRGRHTAPANSHDHASDEGDGGATRIPA